MSAIARPALQPARASLALALLVTACRSPAPPAPTGDAAVPVAASAATSEDAAPATPELDAATVDAPASVVAGVVWQSTGARLAIARGATVTLVDPRKPGEGVRLGPHAAPVTEVIWSDDGARVAFLSGDGNLRVHRAGDGSLEHTLPLQPVSFNAGVFSHDGNLLAVDWDGAGWKHSFAIWDLRTGAKLPAPAPEPMGGGFWKLAFLGGDRQLAAFDAVAVTVWDVTTGKRTGGRGFETGATSPVTLSPDGRFAAVSLALHALVAWPLGAEREVPLDKADACADHISGIRFSADSRVLTMRSDSGRSGSWSLPSFTRRSRWAPSKGVDDAGEVREVGFMSDDGALVVRVEAEGSVALLDAFTGKKIRALEGAMSMEPTPTFSPDHRWVAQGGAAASLWEIESGRRSPL